jgi:hypothetical protein
MEGQEASHFWVCKQLQKPDQKEVKKKKVGLTAKVTFIETRPPWAIITNLQVNKSRRHD